MSTLERLKPSKVSGKYGAPMGRFNRLPDNTDEPVKLQMVRLRWVDGDYDQGGVYWGGGSGDYIYFAKGDTSDVVVEVYVRAKRRNDAKAEVRKLLPNARFYN